LRQLSTSALPRKRLKGLSRFDCFRLQHNTVSWAIRCLRAAGWVALLYANRDCPYHLLWRSQELSRLWLQRVHLQRQQNSRGGKVHNFRNTFDYPSTALSQAGIGPGNAPNLSLLTARKWISRSHGLSARWCSRLRHRCKCFTSINICWQFWLSNTCLTFAATSKINIPRTHKSLT
jgi:hypothetical protein